MPCPSVPHPVPFSNWLLIHALWADNWACWGYFRIITNSRNVRPNDNAGETVSARGGSVSEVWPGNAGSAAGTAEESWTTRCKAHQTVASEIPRRTHLGCASGSLCAPAGKRPSASRKTSPGCASMGLGEGRSQARVTYRRPIRTSVSCTSPMPASPRSGMKSQSAGRIPASFNAG
jgi:hypothetical protein